MTKNNKSSPIPAPEWSFMVDAEKIETKKKHFSIKPDAAELKALARRMGVVEIKSLESELDFVREGNKAIIHVTGRLKAAVRQECVVTGKPVNSDITEDFEGWFTDKSKTLSFVKARQEKQAAKAGVEFPILPENEDPEPIIDGQIDAGELTTQYLSLAIDPYPRAADAAYDNGDDAPNRSSRPDNPFAALKDWRDKNKLE
jgi:hypothetical protein